jgi:hypothetical protein
MYVFAKKFKNKLLDNLNNAMPIAKQKPRNKDIVTS